MSVNSEEIPVEEDATLREIEAATPLPPFRNIVRSKAREQLDVSIDSPFRSEHDRTELLRRRQIEAKATSLKDETSEIRRQLNLVKSQLGMLKTTENQQQSKPLIGNNNNQKAKNGYDRARQAEPKLRPLTGRADCPNCVCDRRRSVCDNCIATAVVRPPRRIDSINIAGQSSQLTSVKTSDLQAGGLRLNDYDERPIRPAPTNDQGEKLETIDDVVVPGRVYTISKSLNEKRAKLAQMIDELELLMGKVRKKDNRLDEERKIVNLYKQQWHYGPNIGGPSASSRERLGVNRDKRSYQSKLDSNLLRDSKSLMGYRHVESDLKLRQHSQRHQSRVKTAKSPPRSKSLESLRSVQFNEDRTGSIRRGQEVNSSNFENGKSSSVANLSRAIEKTPKVGKEEKEAEDEEDEEEEEIQEEEGIEDVVVANTGDEESRVDSTRDLGKRQEVSSPQVELNPKVKRMGWIPVFGETEIKQVKLAPKRKVQILSSEINRPTSKEIRPAIPTQSQLSAVNRTSSMSTNKRIQQNSLREVRRGLMAATDLLEQEQQDCKTKNQLIIKRRSLPAVGVGMTNEKQVDSQQTLGPPNQRRVSNGLENNQKNSVNPSASVSERNKEIARLEEKLDEQQKLLERLAQLRERAVVSPVTVTCSSPCCHIKQTSGPAQSPIINRAIRHSPSNKSQKFNCNRQMMIGLQRKLEQTKSKLVRTLEEELVKQEYLKEKVDCSMKKQTNLQNDSDILKQALTDCIDSCLDDLSSTIESLTFGAPTAKSSSNNRSDDLNKHLRQMKAHIETIERQRKDIFDELDKEKLRSNKMELELKSNRDDLNKLLEAKEKLELQLNLFEKPAEKKQPLEQTQPEEATHCQASTGSPARVQPEPSNNLHTSSIFTNSQTDTTDKSEYDDSYNSIDLYRRYVQSMSLDTESLRRERKLIFSEFDNIKKMLIDIDKS